MKPERRILHVLGGLNRGGVETWLMHVLRSIDRDRFAMDFLVHTTRPGAFDDEVRDLGARIHPVPYTKQPLRYVHGLRRVLTEHGPYDVIHSHVFTYSGFVMRAADALGVPVRIAHSHNGGMDWLEAGWRRRTYTRLMRRWIWRYATRGIGISDIAADTLFGDGWRNDPRFEVVLYGFDFSRFADPVPREAAKRELGIPPERPVVGHIGSFTYQKNHEYLIDLFAGLVDSGVDAHLLLVGDGSGRGDIEAQLTRLGLVDRATLTGERHDVAPCLAAMDLFLFPSRYEGLGIVALEAQAAGVPVLGSLGVPDEATVVPALVRKLSLERPRELWIDAAREVIERPPVLERPAAEIVAESQFGIRRCLEDLGRIYLEPSPGRARSGWLGGPIDRMARRLLTIQSAERGR